MMKKKANLCHFQQLYYQDPVQVRQQRYHINPLQKCPGKPVLQCEKKLLRKLTSD